MSIILPSRRTSRPNHPSPISKRRRAFALEATLDAFGRGAIHHLNGTGFEDHQPDHGPRPLGEVAAQVVNDTGEKALRHWLAQAAGADNEQDRSVALEIAHEIARLAGIDLAEKEAA